MIKIRKFQPVDTKKVSKLIVETYKKFNSSEYFNKLAVKKYIDSYELKKNSLTDLLKKFKRTPIFFIAVNNKEVIGMIRGTRNRIVNLFVQGNYHKKGVGTLLVKKFCTAAKISGSKNINLRSSLFAVSFYQKNGFKKTTGMRNFHGLKIWPMKKRIFL